MDTLTKQQVADLFNTSMANIAVEVLEETGRTSQVIWEGPRPILPYKKNGYELSEVGIRDEYDLPLEVQRRINILRNHKIPIKQILIAHELPPQPKELPAPPVSPLEPRRNTSEPEIGSHIDWDVLGKVFCLR